MADITVGSQVRVVGARHRNDLSNEPCTVVDLGVIHGELIAQVRWPYAPWRSGPYIQLVHVADLEAVQP